MKRIVIIDDEIPVRYNLRTLLATYCPDIIIAGEADGVKSGVQLIRQEQPDAVLLDTTMGDGTCFDLLDQFSGIEFKILFVTANPHFGADIFRFDALCCVLKLLHPEELAATIERLWTVPQEVHTRQLKNFMSETRQGRG